MSSKTEPSSYTICNYRHGPVGLVLMRGYSRDVRVQGSMISERLVYGQTVDGEVENSSAACVRLI
jgi:hypothetical protein